MMESKTVVITGANSGIGKYTAIELAKQKSTIVMLCRNMERSIKAKDEIINISGNNSVFLIKCDLSSMTSVRRSANELLTEFSNIDVLINNAGVYLHSKQITEDGFEKTFAINHLGHFLLTDLLLERINESNDPRIINVSSAAHYGSNINFNNINAEQSYSGFRRYGMTKLANILFTFKLNRKFKDKGISINSLHPGFAATNLAKSNGAIFRIVMTLLRPFQISAKRGAQPSIFLASSPKIKHISGKYFEDKSKIPFSKPKISSTAPDPICFDKNLQDKLWDISLEMVNLH